MPLIALRRRVTFALVAVAVGVGGIAIGSARNATPTGPADAHPGVPSAGRLQYQRLDHPARTIARIPSGKVVATMTDGSRTVALLGPERIFADPGLTAATVTTSTWVRILPRSWSADADRQRWFRSWLDQALSDTSPDLFAVALQYLRGQPAETDATGVIYRGDAGFGPEIDGAASRKENSDFYDYLGVPWTFADGKHAAPDPAHYRDIDCSGYLRLVLGYRMGLPLLNTNGPGAGLPRRAYAIAAVGPGTVIIPDRSTTAHDYTALQPGDLVFFNLDTDPQIDHAALYLGLDDSGHHRFLSSRGKADGPTLGDLGGTSLLDDSGYYSRGFRTARRI